MLIWLIGCALIGAILASSVTCITGRHYKAQSQKGRSFCDTCHKTLPGWVLIPIIGYLLCRGQCHACKSKVPIRYPILEAAGALALSLGVWRFGPGLELLWFGTLLILLFIITGQDISTHTVSDIWQILFLLLSLVHLFFGWGEILVFRLFGGILLALPLILLQRRNPEGLGTGDVLFVANMGFLLGPEKGVIGFATGIGTALLYALWVLYQGGNRKTALPLLPFLALGTIAGLLVGR